MGSSQWEDLKSERRLNCRRGKSEVPANRRRSIAIEVGPALRAGISCSCHCEGRSDAAIQLRSHRIRQWIVQAEYLYPRA